MTRPFKLLSSQDPQDLAGPSPYQHLGGWVGALEASAMGTPPALWETIWENLLKVGPLPLTWRLQAEGHLRGNTSPGMEDTYLQ